MPGKDISGEEQEPSIPLRVKVLAIGFMLVVLLYRFG
jgi:hypothetical protein